MAASEKRSAPRRANPKSSGWRLLLIAIALVFGALLFVGGCSAEDADSQSPGGSESYVGPWSEVVGGLRGRLVTSFGDVSSRPNATSVFLELESVSDTYAPIEIVIDREVRVELLDQDMRPVQPGSMIWSGGRPGGTHIQLLPDSRHRYRISGTGCSGPGDGAAGLCFFYANWVIQDDDPGTYFVRGVMRVAKPDPFYRFDGWTGELDLPPTPVDRGLRRK